MILIWIDINWITHLHIQKYWTLYLEKKNIVR